MTEEKAKDVLTDLKAAAVEAETDPGRHRKEAIILATVAKEGKGNVTLRNWLTGLEWSREDYHHIAAGILECLLARIDVHPDTVKKRLSPSVTIPDEVLEDALDAKKAVPVSVAQDHVDDLTVLDQRQALDDLGRALQQKAKGVKTKDEAAVIFGSLSKNIHQLAKEKKLVRETLTEGRDAGGFLKELEARKDSSRKWMGLDSGLDHLNNVLDGLDEGLYILAGSPGSGKTTLAKQIADTVALNEKTPVLFYTFEQSKRELRLKTLARMAAVDSRKIRKCRTGPESWQRVQEAFKDYLNGAGRYLKIIEGKRTDTVDAIRAAALGEKDRAGDKPILIVIDYLQIIPAGRSAPDSIRERVDYNLTELRRLAGDIQSPILALSSLNREGFKAGKPPTLTGMKESGGIEYSADAVLALWLDVATSEAELKDYQQTTFRVEIRVLKQRNGDLGKIKTNFTPAFALFDEPGQTEDDCKLSRGEAMGAA